MVLHGGNRARAVKTIKTIGAVLGAIIIIGIIYLFLADFGSYKPEIEAAATEATGREFRINGDLEIGVLPSPTAHMTDVTLANAPWADDPALLEIGELSVELGLWSLLFGPIVVKDFQLHDVQARIETNEDGESNLDFETPEEEPPVADEEEAATESPLVLRNANISNINVVM